MVKRGGKLSLNLDIETHIYTDAKGVVIPSVTQIINAAFPYKTHSNAMADYYRDRGKAVHAAIHYLEKGTLDPASVHKDVWPYIKAYFKFRDTFKYKTLATEEIVFNKKFGYCGTLDRRTKGAIWDYKTGVNRYVDGIQLSAYAEAKGMKNAKRFSVYLMSTGNYWIKEHEENKTDFRIFLACFQIYQAKKLHNLLDVQEGF